jgi:hypothetical protein
MKKLTQKELQRRIIARGEHSGHAHIITGDAIVREEKGNVYIDITGDASIKHLLEDAWLRGEEQWTKEHGDICLTNMPDSVRHGDVALKKVSDKTYMFIQQTVYDPLSKRIEAARD